MTSRTTPPPSRRAAAVGAALLTAALLGGCGDSTASADRPAPPLPKDPGTVLRLAAVDVQWDVAELTAPAGKMTIRLDHRDKGIPHNVRVRGPEKAFATEVVEGPEFQDLTFTIDEPGSYTYVCDAHPNMKGELVVTEPVG